MLLAAAQMGFSLPPITYYDFRYPNANKIMIIIDEELDASTETFYLALPSTGYFFYGREWSFGLYRSGATKNLSVNNILQLASFFDTVPGHEGLQIMEHFG